MPGQIFRYAALSHCWGTKTFTTLTLSNIERFRQHVPAEALTKTFNDAIFIARAIGFNYLWIDSLCIIQDCPKDWQRESAEMTRVYGGADLNIAATSAENGDIGCFFDRDGNWRCQVRQSGSPILWDVFPQGLLDASEINILDSRAWVLQERYLSCRTLHFTANEVFWECDGNPACETLPNGYPPWVRTYIRLGFDLRKRPLTREHWPVIVEDYSRRALTKKTDRFPALAGLAGLIQEHTKDEYVAGMGREDLEDQLAWICRRNVRLDAPSSLPTWSWATLRNLDGLYYPKHNGFGRATSQLHISVESIQIQYATPNRLGQVVGGTARLQCDILCCARASRLRLLIGDQAFYPIHDLESGEYLPNFHIHLLVIRHGTVSRSLCTGLLLKPTVIRGEYQRIWAYRLHAATLGTLIRGAVDYSGEKIEPDGTVKAYKRFEAAVAEENLVTRDSVEHFAHVSTENGVKRYFIDLV
jgi:hypothetical protein